jgi:hypothetical protein
VQVSAYDFSMNHSGPLTLAVSKQTIDALSDAVRSENYRIHAYEAQRRYEMELYI